MHINKFAAVLVTAPTMREQCDLCYGGIERMHLRAVVSDYLGVRMVACEKCAEIAGLIEPRGALRLPSL